MTKYVFDSYAWIEYFIASSKGVHVRRLLENGMNEIFTPVIVVAEVCAKAKKDGFDYNEAHRKIVSMSQVESMDSVLARDAGVLKEQTREKIGNFGIVDSIILLTARKLEAKVLTGDYHLKGFEEAEFLQ